jgi:hypothetical protein
MPEPGRSSSLFQFSLLRLMIVVTLVAVLLGFGGMLDDMLAAVVFCLVPTPLIIVAIYGRRDYQAFAIGALVPWVVLAEFRQPPRSALIMSTVWLIVVGAICGAAAVTTRRWLERTENADEKDRDL